MKTEPVSISLSSLSHKTRLHLDLRSGAKSRFVGLTELEPCGSLPGNVILNNQSNLFRPFSSARTSSLIGDPFRDRTQTKDCGISFFYLLFLFWGGTFSSDFFIFFTEDMPGEIITFLTTLFFSKSLMYLSSIGMFEEL